MVYDRRAGREALCCKEFAMRQVVTLVSFMLLCGVMATPAFGAPLVAAPAQFSAAFQDKLEDDYGVREGERLRHDLNRILTEALARVDAAGPTHNAISLVVTIEDARPNRPTFAQLNARPGLSYLGSFSTGGAQLSASFRDPSGRVIQTVTRRWYETDIDQVVSAAPWHDAQRAMRMFARDVARAYAALPAQS
jgi:hypothetical protein